MSLIVIKHQVTGLVGMINAMEKMSHIDPAILVKLDTDLARAFLATQGRTHVISRRLKDSGRYSSTFRGQTWTGTIKYGGLKIRDRMVDYGIYELARGGSHDFLAPADERAHLFESTLDSFFTPLKGR